MNYYTDDNDKVYAYDDGQVTAGLADDKTSITETEKEALLTVTLTDEETALAALVAYDATLPRNLEDAYQGIVDLGGTLADVAQTKLDTKTTLRTAYLALV